MNWIHDESPEKRDWTNRRSWQFFGCIHKKGGDPCLVLAYGWCVRHDMKHEWFAWVSIDHYRHKIQQRSPASEKLSRVMLSEIKRIARSVVSWWGWKKGRYWIRVREGGVGTRKYLKWSKLKNKQTNTQANKQTNKQTNKQASKQAIKQANKQTNKQTIIN